MPVLPDKRVACYHRLVSFGDALIAVDSTRRGLHVVTGQGNALQRELPFTIGELSLNWATVAGGYLYALSSDGRILLTRDLVVWETVAEELARARQSRYERRVVEARTVRCGPVLRLDSPGQRDPSIEQFQPSNHSTVSGGRNVGR
jgi:hypothetical protein